MPSRTSWTTVWRPYLPLILICIGALLARLLVAAACPNVIHPDETMQYLEQAHRVLTGHGLVPWEYKIGARSWVIPGILVPVMGAAAWISDAPEVTQVAIWLFSSLLSLAVVVSSYALGMRANGRPTAIAAALFVAFWPEILMMSPHVLADTICIVPLSVALAIGYRRKPGTAGQIWTGAMLAAAVMLRPQLAPAVAVAGIWMCGLDWRRYLAMAVGGVIVIAIFGAVDWVTWGSPFQSFVRYVFVNSAGVAEAFGVTPFYQYLVFEGKVWLVALPLMAVTAPLGARRLPLVAVVGVLIFATFSAVGHKEARFIYPAVPLLFTLCGVGTAELWRLLQSRTGWPARNIAIGLVVLWIISAGAASVMPEFRRRLLQGSGALPTMAAVNADRSVCGVAIYPTESWAGTGQVHFRRDLQLFLLPLDEKARAQPLPFNAIMAFERDGNIANYQRLGFTLGGCHGSRYRVCWYRRASPCSAGKPLDAAPDPDVEVVLRRLELPVAR
jgi:phosphatidylinositol glycan class B